MQLIDVKLILVPRREWNITEKLLFEKKSIILEHITLLQYLVKRAKDYLFLYPIEVLPRIESNHYC